MFGISHVGAGICGFLGNTNEELCSRWMQLGTLYPFSRNHNTINAIPQEPFAFGPTLLQTSTIAIRNRYSLFHHISTGMFMTSLNGGAYFRPTFFEFNNDINLLNNATTHFLLGDSILVHPCIWPQINGTLSYFPYEIWYDFYSGIFVQTDYDNNMYLNMTLPRPIPMHIRGGRIVPTADSSSTVLNLQDLRASNITMVVALDGSLTAYGRIVFDNGLSAATISQKQYTLVYYSWEYNNATSDIFTLYPTVSGYTRAANEFPSISTLQVYGCAVAIRNVYQIYQGISKMIPSIVGWDSYNSVCTIYLSKTLLPPDGSYELLINYFV